MRQPKLPNKQIAYFYNKRMPEPLKAGIRVRLHYSEWQGALPVPYYEGPIFS